MSLPDSALPSFPPFVNEGMNAVSCIVIVKEPTVTASTIVDSVLRFDYPAVHLDARRGGLNTLPEGRAG